MKLQDRGAVQTVALAGLAVVALAVAAMAGSALGSDTPSGEAVLSDIEEQYDSAESVVVQATVTAEDDGTVAQFDVNSLLADDGKMRTNLSTGDGYLVVGSDGGTAWLASSEREQPIVLPTDGLENGSLSAIANGTAPTSLTGSATSTLGTGSLGASVDMGTWNESFDPTTVTPSDVITAMVESDLFVEVNRTDVRQTLEEYERIGDLNNTELRTALDESDVDPATVEAFENLSELNRTELKAELEAGNYDIGTNTSAFESMGGDSEWSQYNWSEKNASFDRENVSVRTILDETNLSAEFVETTTLDGQQVNVVTVSVPDREGQLTVWATTDTATVVKYEVTSPRGTVTVDIAETQFDVSPAASAFQPPGLSPDTAGEIQSFDELTARAPGPVAVPSGEWSFEQGTVLDSPVTAVVGQYTTADDSLIVLQSDSSALTQFVGDGEQVTVAGETVTVTEMDGQTAVQWTTDETTVILTGSLPEDELLDAVERIEFVTGDN